jgi:hypothetical protein
MSQIDRCTAAIAAAMVCAVAGCASTPGRDQPLSVVAAAALSPDGRTLAVSTVEEEVALFDLEPLRFRSLLTDQGAPGSRVSPGAVFRSPPLAFSPDGLTLVAAGIRGNAVGWHADSGAVKWRVPLQGPCPDLAFLPDGRSLLIAGPSIRRLGVEAGNVLDERKPPGNATFASIGVSPDGRTLAAGLTSGEIARYDVDADAPPRILKGHVAVVTGLAYAPDGLQLASTAGRFDPRLWNTKDDAPVAVRLSEIGGVGESLDKSIRETSGLMLFAWLLGTARGFQIVGAPTLGAPPLGGANVDSAARSTGPHCGPRIAYSPDGRFIATTAHLSMVSGEFHVVLVDLAQKKARAINGVYGCSVAFTRDSRFIVTGGLGAPQIRNVETGERVDEGR